MNTTTPQATWHPSRTTGKGSGYIGTIEFQDNSGEWHVFEVIKSNRKIIFGGACNVGFIESGFIVRESYESLDDTFRELLADLETYYNDGPSYTSRIVCNDRM